MTQTKQFFTQMMTEHKEAFEAFKPIHDAYVLNPEEMKSQFNEMGQPLVDIIREYERRLCAFSGKGQFSKFTANLAQKFWDEVRKIYPKIDFVGVR